MRRRHFLVLSAASVGGVVVYSLDRKVSRLSAQDRSPQDQSGKSGKSAAQTLRIPLRFFTEAEAAIVAAAASRIFPSDEAGPGAREAGVVIYIDRQLAGPWGRDAHRYTHEPFDEASPEEFGYQGAATPREIYRQGLKGLAGFDTAPSRAAGRKAEADRERAVFHAAAPQHGRGHVLRSASRRQRGHGGLATDRLSRPAHEQLRGDRQHYGEAFRPKPVSLKQVTENPVRPRTAPGARKENANADSLR